MPEIQEFTAAFLDAFAREMLQRVSGETRVEWNIADTGLPAETLTWWSGHPGSDAEAAFFVGSPEELVQELGGSDDSANARENYFTLLTAALQNTFAERLGADVTLEDSGPAGDPPPDWLVVNLVIADDLARRELYCVLSPALEDLLGQDSESPARVRSAAGGASASLDLLMHVEVPVSVCFGRAKVRMRDLLSYTPGAIVELDQKLGDAVEIRVNNCVIARGEVVAIDGNYGVRVLELASSNGVTNMLPATLEAR